MRKTTWALLVCSALLWTGCDDKQTGSPGPISYGETHFEPALRTDRAVYSPGQMVRLSLDKPIQGDATIRYTHLGEVIKEESLTGDEWSWSPPTEDFKGYLVYLYRTDDMEKSPIYSVAVDVSSDWTKFPRYGFVSDYGNSSAEAMERQVAQLSRFHINAVQFYDWLHDHHKPLAGTPENPADSWPDLIGRTNYRATVAGYIEAMHRRGIKTLFYNLLFGALSNAASDGVLEEWYLYKDPNRQEKDAHVLGAPFRSSIYLTNPARTAWQDYLIQRHRNVYEVFGFDGFHIDQLGNRGTVYDYHGQVVQLDEAYSSFIEAMVKAFPDKYHVMNAVTQYGQEDYIAKSGVDVLYTEVWPPYHTFDDLVGILQDNGRYSAHQKNTVLAAYVNYGRSKQAGFVNEPGVLLANAVIFANGGAHLEIGEHYLANEYFPNNNLQLKGATKDKLIGYYDFMVAYQNLLRDGGESVDPHVTVTSPGVSVSNGSAIQGHIAAYGRRFGNRDVVHLVNFSNASTMAWNDTDGTQREPAKLTDISVKMTVSAPVRRVWTASPDIGAGAPLTLSTQQYENELTIVLPSLNYWGMIVIDYE